MDKAPFGVLVLLVLALLWKKAFGSSKLRLPPGPRPLFIIGNALDMPTVRPWEMYQKWHEMFREYTYV